MNAVLKMLEPTIFPNATSETPDKALEMLTAASGKEVPNATTVRPMMRDEILKNLAMLEAPSTKKSAPFTSNKNPMMSKINGNNNDINMLLFL